MSVKILVKGKKTMKKIKMIALLILGGLLLLPYSVQAEEKEKINVYLFRGEGCPRCEEAIAFFDGMPEEDKQLYQLVSYETWYDKENDELFDKVSTVLGDKQEGVPYIVIGKKSWIGFGEELQEELTKAIQEEYQNENRYDVMKHLDEKKSNDFVSVAIVIGVVVVLGGFVFLARRSTKEESTSKKEEK